MTSSDLLADLVAAADDVGGILAPDDLRGQLIAICRTATLVFDAAAVSIARVDGDGLVYEAAFGRGADAVVGMRMEAGRGIAGYVAQMAQALIVEQVERDPRFARDVAERIGYVPSSMLVTPIVAASGEVAGVLSVLDRGESHGDTLSIAGSFADQAALVLPRVDLVTSLAPILLAAVAEAADDRELSDSIRRRIADVPATSADLAELTAVLVDVRAVSPEARAAATRVLAEFATFARSARRRR